MRRQRTTDRAVQVLLFARHTRPPRAPFRPQSSPSVRVGTMAAASPSSAPFEPGRAATQVPAAAAELSMLLSPHAGALESVRIARVRGARQELRPCGTAPLRG